MLVSLPCVSFISTMRLKVLPSSDNTSRPLIVNVPITSTNSLVRESIIFNEIVYGWGPGGDTWTGYSLPSNAAVYSTRSSSPVVEVWIEIRCIFSPWISIIFVELGCGRRPPGALDLAGFSFHVPTHGSADIAAVATAARRKRIITTVRFISESFHYNGCYSTEASIVFPKSRQ